MISPGSFWPFTEKFVTLRPFYGYSLIMSKQKYIGPALRTVLLVQSNGTLMRTSLRPHKEGGFAFDKFGTWDEYDGEEL